MKKFILIIVILFILILGLLPVIDGYFFKNIYLEKVAYYRDQMQADNMQLQVESYHVGWLQSTATLTITKTMGSGKSGFYLQPMVMRITSIIQHGPLVYANNKLRVASAYVKTAIDLPDILKVFIPQNTNGFLQIDSDVSLNGNVWDSHYAIPAIITPIQGGWDGLTGDIVVNSVNGVPVKIYNQAIFGKLSIPAFSPLIPEVKLEAISTDTVLTRKYDNIWVGSANLKTPGMYAKWGENNIFSLTSLSVHSSYDASNNLYSYNTDFDINSIQLPPSAAITRISNFTAAFAIKNLDINGLQNLKEYSKAMTPATTDDMQRRSLLLKLLSPSTSFGLNLKMDTDQGAVSAKAIISLLSLPKSPDQIENNVNADLQVRMAQSVFNKLLINSLVQQYNRAHYAETSEDTTPAVALSPETMASLAQDAQAITNKLIEWNYIQQDNADYVISFTRKGVENTLNGKPISEEELKNIGPNLNQLLNKSNTPAVPTVMTSPPATPPVAPAAPPTTAPAATVEPAVRN